MHQMHEDFCSRAGIINDIPFETREDVEASPHAFVDLHQADITGRGFEKAYALTLANELPPTTLLPTCAFDENNVGLPETCWETVFVNFTPGRER